MIECPILVGGGSSPTLIPYQNNCRHLYMSDKNTLGTNGWSDLIGGINIDTAITINSDSSISLNEIYQIPYTDNFLTECFTFYLVCKRPSSFTDTTWRAIFDNDQAVAPSINLHTYNLNWTIAAGTANYDIFSSVNAKTYAVITIVNYYGYCKFYINNTLIGGKSFFNAQSLKRNLNNELDTYCIALYDVSHYTTEISEIYSFLNNKYLI